VSDNCCTPNRDGKGEGPPESKPNSTLGADGGSPDPNLIELPGGVFTMGNDADYGYPADGEGPAHAVELSPFLISRFPVTNRQFEQFTEATGYVTEAQSYGWSFVFSGLLGADAPPTPEVAGQPWWRQIRGADWAHPLGPDSNVVDLADHPVVHVSWNDAVAYCDWTGSRLPTEAEWEFAARGGIEGMRFPWGKSLEPDGVHRMNVFQGAFPESNTLEDGFAGTAPIETYEPNGFGLFQMTGNVWEWVSDWFDQTYYSNSAAKDPTGPKTGGAKVIRGGSYLCHASYCNRYRVDSRSSNGPDSSTGNMGFRVARSLNTQ